MKRLITALFLLTISLSSFASTSSSLMDLGQSWKKQEQLQATADNTEINIVYGGEDITRRPTIALHTTTA